MTDQEIEEEKTSTLLEECKQDLVENSNRAKSLQRQLLLFAKELKSKNIDQHIPKEEKRSRKSPNK